MIIKIITLLCIESVLCTPLYWQFVPAYDVQHQSDLTATPSEVFGVDLLRDKRQEWSHNPKHLDEESMGVDHLEQANPMPQIEEQQVGEAWQQQSGLHHLESTQNFPVSTIEEQQVGAGNPLPNPLPLLMLDDQVGQRNPRVQTEEQQVGVAWTHAQTHLEQQNMPMPMPTIEEQHLGQENPMIHLAEANHPLMMFADPAVPSIEEQKVGGEWNHDQAHLGQQNPMPQLDESEREKRQCSCLGAALSELDTQNPSLRSIEEQQVGEVWNQAQTHLEQQMPMAHFDGSESQLGEEWHQQSRQHHLEAAQNFPMPSIEEKQVGEEWNQGQAHLSQQNPMPQLDESRRERRQFPFPFPFPRVEEQQVGQQNPMSELSAQNSPMPSFEEQQVGESWNQAQTHLEQQMPMAHFDGSESQLGEEWHQQSGQHHLEAAQIFTLPSIEEQQVGEEWNHGQAHLGQQNPMPSIEEQQTAHLDEGSSSQTLGAPWSFDAMSAGIDQILHPAQFNENENSQHMRSSDDESEFEEPDGARSDKGDKFLPPAYGYPEYAPPAYQPSYDDSYASPSYGGYGDDYSYKPVAPVVPVFKLKPFKLFKPKLFKFPKLLPAKYGYAYNSYAYAPAPAAYSPAPYAPAPYAPAPYAPAPYAPAKFAPKKFFAAPPAAAYGGYREAEEPLPMQFERRQQQQQQQQPMSFTSVDVARPNAEQMKQLVENLQNMQAQNTQPQNPQLGQQQDVAANLLDVDAPKSIPEEKNAKETKEQVKNFQQDQPSQAQPQTPMNLQQQPPMATPF